MNLVDQSYQFFLEEAGELLDLIDRGLETVFHERTNNQVHDIARAAHSLKGGARSAGLEDLGNIAFKVEKSFKALYNPEVELDRQLETYLQEIYQALRNPLRARLQNREGDEKAALAKANTIWEQIETKLGDALAQAEEYLPSSADLGIDIAASIFELDVGQGMETLRQALENPAAGNLTAELTTQIEVCSGFGEMLSLPGFGSICQAAAEALNQQPAKVREIAQCFLNDVQAAREAVLAGDRTSGGQPSAQLLALASPQQPATESYSEPPIDFGDRAYQFFIQEAPEFLYIIESGLLSLRQERTTAKVHEIMRAAHSIKGGSATVGLEAIKTIAHKLEDIFKALYDEEIVIDNELESWLLEGYDCLHNPLMEQLETNRYNPAAALATAETVWQKIASRLGDSLTRADDYLPSSSDLGIDMVASMFEIDVEQELERLRDVVSSPGNQPLAGELRATLEVFAGFGEMLNLPGFAQIAQQGLTALAQNPERVSDIIQVIIRDVTAAKELVLNGDRSLGGEPSPELLALAGGKVWDGEITNFPSLDEVFGSDLDREPLEQEEIEPEIPFLEAIFAPELSNDEIELGEKGDGEELEGDEATVAPSLEEVFGNADLSILATTGESAEEVFGEGELSLDAFGETETEEILESEPLLEEVFGEQPPALELPPTPSAPPSEPQLTAPEQLHRAVESIGKIYAYLPSVENERELNLPKGTSSPAQIPNLPKQKPANSSVAKTHLTVRVDLERLERMNNLIGELAINRNSLSLQNDKLQNAVKELLNRFVRFQHRAGNLREMAERMLIAPEKFGKQNKPQLAFPSNLTPEGSDLSSLFDSLEMDTYDSMYSLVQGLIEQMIQLEEAVDDISLFAKQSGQTVEAQRSMLNSIRDELMWARMLPLGEVLNRFPRLLRDLSLKYHKRVNLKLSGINVLVDKAALEKLYDPLVHLVRNAFDHGIETAAVREQQGKDEEGTVAIRAYHQGNQTIIEVTDDGCGINLEQIARKALERGLISAEQLAVIPKDNLLELIFEPGFSTAAQISELSGRGVGLDIVRSQLRALKGTIRVDSNPGKGTTFTLSLPLTLTIDKLLVLLAGPHFYAFPSDNVEDIIVPQPGEIKTSGNQRFLTYEEQVIPIYALTELLNYRSHVAQTIAMKSISTLPTPEDWGNPLLLLRQGQQIFAIEVESLVSEQELVIKPFSSALTAPSYSYGCTILGDGTLIPVINGSVLLEKFFNLTQTGAAMTLTAISPPVTAAAGGQSQWVTSFQVPSVLIVDDSVAMRRTLALSLEKAGYRVLQAKDGREALEQLTQSSNINLVICDIEMPNMNGFEFLGQRRRYPEMMKIPVAMLTSRSNDKHRKLATHLGADAYFTKPYIEQKFLAAINKMIKPQVPVTI
jgi:chemotaxis family two-component system sensor histidine kinase/response regulator PixL